jgi:DNA-binding transcriptional regulator YbjK
VTTTTTDATGTRERILRAALKLIGTDGIGAVSNRRLAAEAEVSLGTLTYHFPAQNDLLKESLLLDMSEEVARLTEIADAIKSADPSLEDALAQSVQIALESMATQGNARWAEQLAVYELHLQAARDPELREASKRCFEAFDEVAVAALDALGLPSSREHARVIVALITGVQLRAIGSGEHDEAGLSLALALLARGASA